MDDFYIHESSYVDDNVEIGENTKIWHFCHIQQGAKIGKNCSLGQNVNISSCVTIGNNVRIQNNVSVYHGVLVEDNVFLGPSCVFTNDLTPRVCYLNENVNYLQTRICKGASVGANATIVCGNKIGAYAMIGAGSVVTKDVKNHELVVGVPARHKNWVCKCGEILGADLKCSKCNKKYNTTKEGVAEVNG